MTALDIYDGQLDYIMSEDGHFIEQAVYDVDDSAVIIYGIFDDSSFPGNNDKSGQKTRAAKASFTVRKLPAGVDVYAEKEIFIVRENKGFKIQSVEKDDRGVTTIWLV